MSKQIFGFFRKKSVLATALCFGGVSACQIAHTPKSLASPYIPPPDQMNPYYRGGKSPAGMPGFRHGPPPPPYGQLGTPPSHAGQFSRSGQPVQIVQPSKSVKAAKAAPEETVELQHSNPMIGQAGAWQTWSNVISLAPGLDKMPLYFVVENGAKGAAKFQDVKVFLNRKPFITTKDFAGTSTFSRDLKGTLGTGNTEITVQGFGPTGSQMVWRLSTKKLVISAVKPSAFSLTDKVTIEGTTLPTNAAYIKVFIANKPVTVVNVQPKNQLQLKLPDNLPGGKQDLIAMVGPLKSNTIQVTVKAAPHVYSVNFVSTAPGQPVIVTGKGFSATASDNTVTVGGASATVTSATDTTLTCTVPVDLPAPQWYVPIIVTTNGMASTEKVTINLGQRVIPNEGNPEQ